MTPCDQKLITDDLHQNNCVMLELSNWIAMSFEMQALDDFRSRYDLRSPEFIGNQREVAQLDRNSGLRLLKPAPAMDIAVGFPPSSSADDTTNRYLWVIDGQGIPYIIESPIAVIGHKLPKHTNLTGGGDAYLGGEMWFSSTISIFMFCKLSLLFANLLTCRM